MNGLELQPISKTIYRNNYGYFMLDIKTNSKWKFIPNDTEFDEDMLLSIMDILRNLNEESA